jgi:hypothetical protein
MLFQKAPKPEEARGAGNNNSATKEEARGKNKSDPVSHIPHPKTSHQHPIQVLFPFAQRTPG